jgi:hypothetical protein
MPAAIGPYLHNKEHDAYCYVYVLLFSYIMRPVIYVHVRSR